MAGVGFYTGGFYKGGFFGSGGYLVIVVLPGTVALAGPVNPACYVPRPLVQSLVAAGVQNERLDP